MIIILEEVAVLQGEDFFFIERDNFSRIVGDLIRIARMEKCHISQERLGELSGYDRTYIGAIERGEKNVSFYAIYKILKILNLDPTEFFNQI